MASTKAGGTAKNLSDSGPQYLGVKLADGAEAKPGAIILRQRGTKVEAGKNVRVGKDHTLFAVAPGRVSFRTTRKISFTGHRTAKKVVDVV